MRQILKIRGLVDEKIAACAADRLRHETERDEALKELGNILHGSCVVSNDEVRPQIDVLHQLMAQLGSGYCMNLQLLG